MRVLLLLLPLLLQQIQSSSVEAAASDTWQKHKVKFSLEFSSEDEEAAAKGHYDKMDAMIQTHNSEDHPYKMAHNHLSHLSPEVKASMNGFKPDLLDLEMEYVSRTKRSDGDDDDDDDDDLPESIDWRSYNGSNYVTPVSDQGSCGSCWVFSGVGCLESRYAVKYGADKLQKLSEQNVVDCAATGSLPHAYGCAGGQPKTVFSYAASSSKKWVGAFTGTNPVTLPKDFKGLNLYSSYPYTAEPNLPCRFKNVADDMGIAAPDILITKVKKRTPCPYKKVKGKWKRFCKYNTYTTWWVPAGRSELGLMKALADGPVSAGMATGDKIWGYSSGVFPASDCATAGIDHAVVVVGYGTEYGKDYWLIKNSWGTIWGDYGYLKLERNGKSAAFSHGACGILKFTYYPLL